MERQKVFHYTTVTLKEIARLMRADLYRRTFEMGRPLTASFQIAGDIWPLKN